ncbi:MAG TPA: CDGSH iron-sulfur domain-containing protein [Terriglobales bacterium]|jgi:CDGSH-type Zn-finger protein|nr:CDGSH iron-sulfur domain-containing protein [Terriglobales bacterium]
MAEIKITAKKNGPYVVEGAENVRLLDFEGNAYDTGGKPAFALCRCGHSANKPFCDGTHAKVGFQAPETAAKKSST